MEKVSYLFVKMFFLYNWEIVEVQGALFKIGWGIWLLLPFPTFTSIQGYTAVTTENYWGWGLLILGSIHLAAIAYNRLPIRRWITFIAFIFWIFTVVLIYSQAHRAALIPLFSIIALFMGLNFLRLGVEIRAKQIIDERRSNIGPPEGTAERRSD